MIDLVEMAAPRFDYPTLLVVGSQVLVRDEWMTVEETLPCVSRGHGSLCTRFRVDSDWENWRVVHLRMDCPMWIRHQVVGEI